MTFILKNRSLRNVLEIIGQKHISRKLNCKPETLNGWLKRLGISYKGNQGLKGTFKTRPINYYLKKDGPYIKSDQLKKRLILKDGPYIKSDQLKKRLILEGLKEHKCENCQLTEWLEKLIPIELHHIDGNRYNRIENLQILCYNCHALTPNYKTRGRYKIPDEQLKQAFIETGSIRQTLIKCGMSCNTGNYTRIRKLIS